MSLKRRLKREIQRQVARDGAASVIARLDAASERTDRELREEQARNRIEDTKTVLALMMAIPTTVLCRDLHWKPLEGTPADNRRQLRRFAELIMAECDTVFDNNVDLRKYLDECYERYGVRYSFEE